MITQYDRLSQQYLSFSLDITIIYRRVPACLVALAVVLLAETQCILDKVWISDTRQLPRVQST